MELTAQQIISELIEKFNLTQEALAIKFNVTSRTIERWRSGNNKPTDLALKYMKQVYNGYVSNSDTRI